MLLRCLFRRHASFLSRLQTIARNPTNALPAVKAAIRGYRSNEVTARDIISTIWNILDNNLDDTASIINGVVDLLDDEEQKSNLLASWNGFKIEVRYDHGSIFGCLTRQRVATPTLHRARTHIGRHGVCRRSQWACYQR